jgi:hypothetical protein
LKTLEKGLVFDSFQGQPKVDAREYISEREYEKEGPPDVIV